MDTRKLLFPLLLLIVVHPLLAQQKVVKYGQVSAEVRQDSAMQKFRQNRFGQFIHWGLFSIPAGEWKGKVYPGASEFLKSYADISTEEWAELRHKFNPVRYNPKQWARYARQMGVKNLCPYDQGITGLQNRDLRHNLSFLR